MKLKNCLVFAAFAAASLSTYAEQVGEWTYLLTPGNVGRDPGRIGTRNGLTYAQAQLFKEDDGTYRFRLQGAAADPCLNVKIDAEVESRETDLVITPSKRFPSCPSMRMVIKKDGSGGTVQMLMGRKGAQTWETDEDRDYRLTAR